MRNQSKIVVINILKRLSAVIEQFGFLKFRNPNDEKSLCRLRNIIFYLVNEMVLPSSNYWNIGTGVNKGDILKNKKGISYIKRFAENLAWLMKRIEEGSSEKR